MIGFARTDTSRFGRWWWTVDRWTLVALVCLMGIGAVLILAASPVAAERIGGLGSFQLAQRQIVFLFLGFMTMIGVSLLDLLTLRRAAVAGMAVFLVLLALTLLIGAEIKGATRWLNFAGFSFQPSELVKPTFAVTLAWLLSARNGSGTFPTNRPETWIAVALWLVLVGLLLRQPDLGQAFVISVIFGVELFLAGLPLQWLGVLSLTGGLGLIGAYFALPHVSARIDGFINPTVAGGYQVKQSIEAFMNGGLFGRGPGEGTVKALLPDSHSDFIFAVAGEEFGLIACLIIVGLFAFVVLRSFSRLLNEPSPFVLLAGTGLLVQFGLQALINMASALHLMPTKGMTLPLISYGGSSLVAVAFGMGMVLALTRRRIGAGGAV